MRYRAYGAPLEVGPISLSVNRLGNTCGGASWYIYSPLPLSRFIVIRHLQRACYKCDSFPLGWDSRRRVKTTTRRALPNRFVVQLRKLAIRKTDGLKTSKKEERKLMFIYVTLNALRKKFAFVTGSKLFERVASLTMRLVFPRLPPPAGRYILF